MIKKLKDSESSVENEVYKANMVEFINVSKTYSPTATALDCVNFKIEKGEMVFIVGASGAGKSTLARLLLLQERPSSGSIIVDGEDITAFPLKKIPEYRRKLGIVFQDFMLFPDKTAYENVAFAMRAIGTPVSEIKQRVPALLSLVNMQYAANRYQHELSGGESQRIALARALANNPDIIIADEPTGNVDPNMSNEIMNLLAKVNKLGKTVIIVTHDWDLVERFNMRVIGLKHGRLVEEEDSVKDDTPYEFSGNTDSEK